MAKKDTVTLSWGRPKIEVLNLSKEGAKWQAFPTPAEGTTNLETTQGEKMEAKVEGGTNEAVKYKANSHKLTLDIRQASDRADANDNFIEDVDGVVNDEYAVRVTPEDGKAVHALMRRAAVNVQAKYTANDGWIKTYTFDSMKPADKEDGSPVPQLQLGAKSEIADWDMGVTAG